MIFAFEQKARIKNHFYLSLLKVSNLLPIYIIILTNPGEKRGNIQEQLKMHNIFA